jgi:hypothetical protein
MEQFERSSAALVTIMAMNSSHGENTRYALRSFSRDILLVCGLISSLKTGQNYGFGAFAKL